MEAPEMLSITT